MFNPTQIVFAPTGRCNLFCAHCRVRRDRGELSVEAASAFLRACAGKGIERVGFSGGEPFLRPDFLVELSRAAVENDFLFDRLMTNGVWYRDASELRKTLADLYEAGFDGTFGLSVDAWHAQDPLRLAEFLDAVFSIWGRKDCVEIVSVGSRPREAPMAAKTDGAARCSVVANALAADELAGDDATMALLRKLAALLGGELVVEDSIPVSMVDPLFLDSGPKGEEARAGGAALCLSIVHISYSAAGHGEGGWAGSGSTDAGKGLGEEVGVRGAWAGTSWFVDDRCEGPGQVLYVHPDGSVAVCCGFANENPELAIGSISEGLESLLEYARENPQARACYGEGLAAVRKRLESAGQAFPGIADDQCFFCDWLCRAGPEIRRAIAETPAAPSGKPRRRRHDA